MTAVYVSPPHIFFSFHFRKNEEKQSFLTSGTTINYRTISPYADVIKDDIIQVESPDVVDANTTDSVLFNGTMPDRTTRMYFIYIFRFK